MTRSYFAWLTEYPDEGSALIAAPTKLVATQKAREQLGVEGTGTPLTVVRATVKQAKVWNAAEA